MNQEAFFVVSNYVTNSIPIFKLLKDMQKALDHFASKGIGMIHSQVGSRMMALRLSACLMDLELRQDNVKEKTEQLYGTIKDAAKWYNEFLNQDNQEE